MSPDELRDHAAAIMIDHAKDVERMSIQEHLEEQGIEWDRFDALAIYDLISRAELAVDFPEGGDGS